MAFRLIYLSTAHMNMTTQTLDNILSKARINNARDGITGLTAYHKFSFIQILEGPKAAVLDCFERIKQSPYHHDITLVWEEDNVDRIFEDFAMAFVEVSDEDQKKFSEYRDLRELFGEPFSRRIARDLATQSFFGTFLEAQR